MDERNAALTTVLHVGGPAPRDSGLRTGSIMEHALSRLTPEQLDALCAKAMDEALRLETLERQRKQELHDTQQNVQLHIDAVRSLALNGGIRNAVITDTKTSTGNMHIETKPAGLLSRIFG